MATKNKMNTITRTEQKQLTRQKLIEATFEVIAAEGFSGVTMAKVAQCADLSRGIGNFHFQTKEQLLLETLHALYREFENAWRSAIANAGPAPIDQLTDLIKRILEPPIADPKKVAVWMAYWGETPSRKTYMELCEMHDREWEAAVEKILRSMVSVDFNPHGMKLHAIAESLIAMMDGFWLEYLLAPDRFKPQDAIKACFAFLSSFFPDFQQSDKDI